MAKKKRPVSDGLRVKAYFVLCDAVEGGIEYGWNRAHKHNDKPDEETLKAAIEEAVIAGICEYFDFQDESNG